MSKVSLASSYRVEDDINTNINDLVDRTCVNYKEDNLIRSFEDELGCLVDLLKEMELEISDRIPYQKVLFGKMDFIDVLNQEELGMIVQRFSGMIDDLKGKESRALSSCDGARSKEDKEIVLAAGGQLSDVDSLPLESISNLPSLVKHLCHCVVW